MVAIDFPDSPSDNLKFEYWKWDATRSVWDWDVIPSPFDIEYLVIAGGGGAGSNAAGGGGAGG